jgi:SPP1 family phage portal protein
LIFDVLALKGSAHDWRGVDITFTRNLPTNETEIANMVSTLDGIVSSETLLAQLPFVENVDDELDRLKTQKEESVAAFYNETTNFLEEDKDNE